MKALIGAVSDSVPFLGYHKASYIMASALLGSIAYIVLGSVDLSAKVVAFLFFLVNIELATTDLLCEGKYAELMRAKPGEKALWCARMRVLVYIHVDICIYVYMYIYMYTHTHTHTCIYRYIRFDNTCIHEYICIYTHTYTYIYIYIYIYIREYKPAYISTHPYAHIYKNTHIQRNMAQT
jgi:hypothetical protein